MRISLRSLRHDRPLVAVAILTLAIGIGAATAMYSVMQGILLRRLPVRAEDRVVVMWGEHQQRTFAHLPVSSRALPALAARSRAMEAVAGVDYNGVWPWLIDDAGAAGELRGTLVSGGFFDLLGVRPLIGRLLRPEDDRVGAPSSIVITEALWRRRYGADPQIVGRSVNLLQLGATFTIIGVAPNGFAYPRGVEAWGAAAAYGGIASGAEYQSEMDVVARLRPGATVEQARAELARFLAADDGPLDARIRQGVGAVAHTLPSAVVGDARTPVIAVGAAVALVLLIACVNVAGLLLVRGAAREREVAIRIAIGATRARLAREALAESAVIAIAGGILGVLLATWGVSALVALAPAELPRLDQIRIDARAVAAGVGLTTLAAMIAGAAPALWAMARDPGEALRASREGSRGTSHARAARRALVVAQITLSVVVLAGAGLLIRSLVNLRALDPGFAVERVTIAQLAFPWRKFFGSSAPTGAERNARYLDRLDAVIARVGALPGVAAVTATIVRPLSGTGGWDALLVREGATAAERATSPFLNLEVVPPNFFAAMLLAPIRGRALQESDRTGTPRVLVLSESAARLLAPGGDVVGRRVRMPGGGDTASALTVVGVVPDTRWREFEHPRPTMYLPYRQAPDAPPSFLLVRARGDADALDVAIRRVVREVDPDFSLAGVTPLGSLLDAPLARPRFLAALMSGFAAIALGLALVGLYGVVAAMARHRRRELGIRLALGATRGDVGRLVMREAIVLGLTGLGLGVTLALVVTRALRSVLYGVSPSDPAALAGVCATMLIAALLASWLPAWRASRVDPVESLRAE